MTTYAANPNDRHVYDNCYVFRLGAYAWDTLVVWASDLDSAIDEMVDWISSHKPTLLCDDDVQREYEEALSEGFTEEEAWDRAQIDVTAGGNGSYIRSDDWSLAAENPTGDALAAFGLHLNPKEVTVVDYDTNEPLPGSASEELIDQNLEYPSDTGALAAYLDEETWFPIGAHEIKLYRDQLGCDVRTVYLTR